MSTESGPGEIWEQLLRRKSRWFSPQGLLWAPWARCPRPARGTERKWQFSFRGMQDENSWRTPGSLIVSVTTAVSTEARNMQLWPIHSCPFSLSVWCHVPAWGSPLLGPQLHRGHSCGEEVHELSRKLCYSTLPNVPCRSRPCTSVSTWNNPSHLEFHAPFSF